MHLQSPVWCNIFGATSSTIVTFSTKSINSIIPKINLLIEAWTTLVALGGTVALLNYFRKIDKEWSLKIILAVVWVLSISTKLKILYTREKISDSQFENCHLYSG